MYKVIELQTALDNTTAHLVFDGATLNEAESKYHMILAAAAVSEVPIHAAIIVSDFAQPVKFDYYDHRPAPTPVEPEVTVGPDDGE